MYNLMIGDYAYSSWSLRGWLLFEKFGIATKTTYVDFSQQSVAEQVAQYVPARTVPTLITPEGHVIWDSLAIAEELAQRHPNAGLWPSDPGLRAMARGLACEMHSGFMALRSDCPMNLYTCYTDVPVSKAVQADLARIETLWSHALERADGPWLCGDYSAADAFFAPVAARIAGYGLQVSALSSNYVARHLGDPTFQNWRAKALDHGVVLRWYVRDYATAPWPVTP